MLALELIDAQLLLARREPGQDVVVLAAEPGVAILQDDATLTGDDAARRMRLTPLLAQSNFWRGLNTQPLTRPSRLIGTPADLAFTQAQALLGDYRDDPDGVLLAIPAGYQRDQLGLLLGVISETGVAVAGMVDAALAACALEPSPARVLHLDLEQHQALLTVLDYAGGESPGLKRSRYEIALRQGVTGIQQSWLKFIASEFVRQTRFDPLHQADSEQRLVNLLPGWLAQCQDDAQIELTMQFNDRAMTAEISREHLIAAVDTHYVQLLQLVQGARVAGLPIDLRVTQRVAALPGLLERFATLRDCELKILPQGAAARGALEHAAHIRRSAAAMALIYQLPVSRADQAQADATAMEATPTQLRPTHVLFQGRAWRITDQPLTIGWAVAGAVRALQLPAALPGISRSHCTLVRRGGAVVVEDHSTYGSYVNQEKVQGLTSLTVGDELRLGAPGVALQLIQIVDDHGQAQD